MLEPSLRLVQHPDAVREIRDVVAWGWGISAHLTHNPAPNPVSLHRQQLERLHERPYVVAEKTDGVRYLLVLGRFKFAPKPYAVMIDRALRMFQLEIVAPSSMYNGSIFDGELVWDKSQNCKAFLVFDAVAVGGESIRLKHFTERYSVVNESFLGRVECINWNRDMADSKARALAKKGYVTPIADAENHMYYCAKQMVPLGLFGSLQRSVKTLSWDSDGFIFTPMDQTVQRNAQRDCFKWKYLPTIDVTIQASSGNRDSHELACQDGDRLVSLSVAFPDKTFDWERPPAFLFATNHVIEITITVSGHTVRCKFHRVRPDKLSPNTFQTIQSVLQEAEEQISIQELIDASMRTK